MAGIAAGGATGYTGAAPSAKLVSLDVMDDQGMAMTSDVIAAADWIYQHKDKDGIRIANFSLIGSTPTSIAFDPLGGTFQDLPQRPGEIQHIGQCRRVLARWRNLQMLRTDVRAVAQEHRALQRVL